MTTLHELLKRNEAADRDQKPRVDLRGRYSPIGISAVAAACRYNTDDDEQARLRNASAPR